MECYQIFIVVQIVATYIYIISFFLGVGMGAVETRKLNKGMQSSPHEWFCKFGNSERLFILASPSQ